MVAKDKPDTTNDPVDTGELAKSDQTPEGIMDHVNNGGRIPDGWAYNNERGYFKPGKVTIPANGPVVVED